MKKIIIVDDSAVLRVSIKQALESFNYEVIGTASGSKELFKLLENSSKPDLILLDMFYPDENGIDILKKLKKDFPLIKILVVTAMNEESLNKQIKQLGADDTLYKPFDMDDLTFAIRKIFL
ncbi:MAG: response regulator transcription factor [Elusimicrobiaceae bacterium]|jgi:DNA-binding response OmpR family regulator|nr:response regulator transcription factor [Elusimicrobiaceae bacterium]